MQTPKKKFGNTAAVIKRSYRAVIQAFHNTSLRKGFAYSVPLLLHTGLGIYIRKSRERNVTHATVTAPVHYRLKGMKVKRRLGGGIQSSFPSTASAETRSYPPKTTTACRKTSVNQQRSYILCMETSSHAP